MSIARFKHPNLALRRPNAHSMTFLAPQSLYPKYCSWTVEPPPVYSFIMYGFSG